MSGARVTINGHTYEAPEGASMSIIGNVVYVDGKKVQDMKDLPQPVKIVVEGSIGDVQADGTLEIEGNIDGDVESRGNVSCWNVHGDVQAAGNVSIGEDAKMDVQAGGNISVGGKVVGSVKAGGNVSYRK